MTPLNQDHALQLAVAVLQMAAAGELEVKYLGSGDPFNPAGGCSPRFRIGKRFTLVAFNDCGCFDYIDWMECDGKLLWKESDERYEDPLDYLTKAEQRALERLFLTEGGIETITETRVFAPGEAQ